MTHVVSVAIGRAPDTVTRAKTMLLWITWLHQFSGEVVDGHLRLKAARKLGIIEVPVILCDEWTEAQAKAFRLR